MPQSNIVTGPAVFTMVAVCVLGMGFMVRFLFALALDRRMKGAGRPIRVKRGHHLADETYGEFRYGKAAANPATHLALGVVRISTVLASGPSRDKKRTVADRPHIVPVGMRTREGDPAAVRRYRLS